MTINERIELFAQKAEDILTKKHKLARADVHQQSEELKDEVYVVGALFEDEGDVNIRQAKLLTYNKKDKAHPIAIIMDFYNEFTDDEQTELLLTLCDREVQLAHSLMCDKSNYNVSFYLGEVWLSDGARCVVAQALDDEHKNYLPLSDDKTLWDEDKFRRKNDCFLCPFRANKLIDIQLANYLVALFTNGVNF